MSPSWKFAVARDNVFAGLTPKHDGLDWLQANGVQTIIHISVVGAGESDVRAHVEKRSEPTLDLFYEIRDADGTLLCVVETVQVFIDLQGVPFLTPPPPVEIFFNGIRAREAVGRPTA